MAANYINHSEKEQLELPEIAENKISSSLRSVLIGKPIANTKIYILDRFLKPVIKAAQGELHIAGDNLTAGYLGKIELTKERFIPNPFQTEEEKRLNINAVLYKTGDLGRWLADGNIECLGRNDFQVKIRGHRIELGEIESVISSYEGIRQSVVLAKTGYLIGYYEAGIKLDEQIILNHLYKKLPEYMIPTKLIHLLKLPLTSSGKIDRAALPDANLIDAEYYQKPRNELEHQLCQIWSELLNLPNAGIGIQDDFFKLGGNSLLAIRLASKINYKYQSHLKIADIFVYKTIQSLTPRIIQTKHNYQSIIKLNNVSNKANLFMIHPGMAGCEVYASLSL